MTRMEINIDRDIKAAVQHAALEDKLTVSKWVEAALRRALEEREQNK